MSLARTRLNLAFRQLLAEQDYLDITVGQILAQAQVSKATFYRHYQRKLDLFIEMHQGLIAAMLADFQQAEDWLSLQPPSSLIRLSLQAAKKGARRSTTAYQLGSDWPLATRMLNQAFANAIAARLQQAFSEPQWRDPVSDVASYLSVMYMDYMMQVNQMPSPQAATQKAQLLQRYTRAMLLESLQQ
ncbi:TetR/AcrR family transcriptional regulator [Ferrimonas senticii]|uniref:TetR/AcrR family transcriptional regulator n=1 Tax=Ferrimonas senticii TaxID=394566 RepID=UPI00041A09E4|nr:TetR/AcrR family transcriptional regulator [Ferrimonas senticii]